jgi:hypothetical protein
MQPLIHQRALRIRVASPAGPSAALCITANSGRQCRLWVNALVELSWHVGFTPDFGRMVATQELTLRAIIDILGCR